MARIFFAALVTVAAAWSQSNERFATVSFLVVDESGKTLSGWKVSSFKANDKQVAALFSGLTGKQIPAGFYEYQLVGPAVSRQPIASDWTPTLGGKIEVLR